ncbi:hypothetical protein IMSHALPRED_010563 [Imshaugia aleurites]|uniref:Uncharacterized protein n=1 Tax=Imshaugia aleurites TaxID=172621 RepID=A0A8H3EU54_9LECA|nr:hypothetical protein IMSHALPRED_010563 [Imshaugia aleurites]
MSPPTPPLLSIRQNPKSLEPTPRHQPPQRQPIASISSPTTAQPADPPSSPLSTPDTTAPLIRSHIRSPPPPQSTSHHPNQSPLSPPNPPPSERTLRGGGGLTEKNIRAGAGPKRRDSRADESLPLGPPDLPSPYHLRPETALHRPPPPAPARPPAPRRPASVLAAVSLAPYRDKRNIYAAGDWGADGSLCG